MRNVSLKVLVKSLKFLFKKGYEPCIQIYKTGGSLVFFEAEPHFGVKFIACLN